MKKRQDAIAAMARHKLDLSGLDWSLADYSSDAKEPVGKHRAEEIRRRDDRLRRKFFRLKK